MKRVLLLALVILFVSSVACATDYAALYADANHTLCAWSGGNFTMYVFSLMNDHDMKAVDFRCVFPAFATPGTVTPGPDAGAWLGNITFDFIVAFTNCHAGWWLICSMPTAYVGGVGVIMITDPYPYQENLYLVATDCNYNDWRLTVLNNLYLGQLCPVIGTRSATWGAIKSLF